MSFHPVLFAARAVGPRSTRAALSVGVKAELETDAEWAQTGKWKRWAILLSPTVSRVAPELLISVFFLPLLREGKTLTPNHRWPRTVALTRWLLGPALFKEPLKGLGCWSQKGKAQKWISERWRLFQWRKEVDFVAKKRNWNPKLSISVCHQLELSANRPGCLATEFAPHHWQG